MHHTLLIVVRSLIIGVACVSLASCSTLSGSGQTGRESALAGKLETIKVTTPEIRNATLADICRWIELASQNADPAHEGIRLQVEQKLARRVQSDAELLNWKPSSPVMEVSLTEFLRFVTNMSGHQVRVTDRQAAMVFKPEPKPAGR